MTDVVSDAIAQAHAEYVEGLSNGVALVGVKYHRATDRQGARLSFNLLRGDLGYLPEQTARMFAAKVGGRFRAVTNASFGGEDWRVTIPYPHEGLRRVVADALPAGTTCLIEREGRVTP